MRTVLKSRKKHSINCIGLRCLAGILLCAMLCGLFSSCSSKKTPASPWFKTLDAKATGIEFNNKLTPTPEFNLFSYMYYYNGGGIGAGDFNNDGLIDLFFSANQGQNKLYLNKGQMKFEDVSGAAAIPTNSGWSTGVSVVDINNDGLLDIYVCKVGHYKSLSSKNEMLVCTGIDKQGIPHYRDEAAELGLDFSGFSTQAAFFDQDGDGDLDMFLLNHSVNHEGNYAPRGEFLNTYDSLAGQKFFRNDSVKTADGKTLRHFTDETKESKIHGSRIGYGLGVAVADINLDGWPDLYVGNDFHENDYLYINQKNGSFSDESSQCLMHTSEFSMGVDVADVNNDAHPEIISMDMLPSDPYILRRSLAEDDYAIFMQKISYGYSYQYARNNLQYNRGNGMFSETGQYSGIYATDWSWSALWTDFDNDGKKDLFISNGIPKRMNDIDYINFVSNDELQQKLANHSIREEDMTLIEKFPEVKLPNRFFQNTGNLAFRDISDSVQDNLPTFSNGAVYADLDNDGDIDIAVNNINEPALIYSNTANNQKTRPYASVQLKGPQDNDYAIGAKLVLYAGDGVRTYEQNAVHGFQSSMLLPIHVGLSDTRIDSAFLVWPDNTYQPISLQSNKTNLFVYEKGLPKFDYGRLAETHPERIARAEDETATASLLYKHQENPFNEFDREPLLPHMLSTEGPALAVADINHDGLDDVFIGASKTFHSAVFLQTAKGKFVLKQEPEMAKDSMWESVDAVWTDVNGDKHPDLVIASGGNEYYGQDTHLLPLLYLNDGKGNLSRKQDAFSGLYVTQSSVAPYDFNGDGYTDLFIAGRAEPWNYGAIPRSYLLQNDGRGKFTDVTERYDKVLQYPGMVTQSQWFDVDRDGNKDLLLCYDWGGIDVFLNQKTHFVKKSLTDKKGWWNFVLPLDVDGDGDTDFIAGNFGINNKLPASEKEPVSLYVNDFDGNGKSEQVMSYYLNGVEIAFPPKMELEKQLPFLKKKFLYAADFAGASLSSVFGKDKLDEARKLSANYFQSAVIINKGGGQFETTALPFEAQLTTYRDAAIIDANQDQLPDILLAGNYYDNNVQLGRNDADVGTVLVNQGKGNFVCSNLNGLSIKGQVRRVRPIQIQDHQAYLLAKNNDSLQVIRFRPGTKK